MANFAPPAESSSRMASPDIDAIEVDAESTADTDSAFGDAESETASLSSSILEHVYENGRRYHAYKSGKYLSPNDEAEADRLDIHHHIYLLQLDGELHLAPLGETFSGRVLDLGAGTGIWAIDMGDKYPAATITGIDLSPIEVQWVPPNVSFEVDDLEEPWTYTQRFDFIHERWLAGSIRNWPRLAQQCYDHLKPGGWVEFKDWDYTQRMPDGSTDVPDNHIKKWHTNMVIGIEKTGAVACPGPRLKSFLLGAGFVDVHEQVHKVPVGSWPRDKRLKEIGLYYGVAMEEGLDAISMRTLTQLLGWDPLEAMALNAHFRREMKTCHFHHTVHIAYGRKPTAP